MRDIKGLEARIGGGTLVGAAVGALGIFHPRAVGLTALALLALTGLLLLPPALLAGLLRVVKFRDRHAYIRLVRPALPQALSPAAFGNSSGGRNVS